MPTKPEEVGVSSQRLARIGEHRQRYIFMTQLMPSSSYPLRRELRVLTYAALVD